jgi:hypothetical protein
MIPVPHDLRGLTQRCIARLATQEFPSSLWCSDDDRLRMISNTLTFEGIVNTAFDELR